MQHPVRSGRSLNDGGEVNARTNSTASAKSRPLPWDQMTHSCQINPSFPGFSEAFPILATWPVPFGSRWQNAPRTRVDFALPETAYRHEGPLAKARQRSSLGNPLAKKFPGGLGLISGNSAASGHFGGLDPAQGRFRAEFRKTFCAVIEPFGPAIRLASKLR